MYDEYVHHLSSLDTHTHPLPFPLRQTAVARMGGDKTPGAAPPPSTSSYLYSPGSAFHLSLYSGPHSSTTLHTQAGEEWGYMMEGEGIVRVFDGRSPVDLPLPTGHCILIPGGTPHSLHLLSGALYLSVTRARKTENSYPHFNKEHVVQEVVHVNGGENKKEKLDELDHLLWMCDECGGVAHQVEFLCTDFC